MSTLHEKLTIMKAQKAEEAAKINNEQEHRLQSEKIAYVDYAIALAKTVEHKILDSLSRRNPQVICIANDHGSFAYEVVRLQYVSHQLYDAVRKVIAFDKKYPHIAAFASMYTQLARTGLLIIDTDRVEQDERYVNEKWGSDVILIAIVEPSF